MVINDHCQHDLHICYILTSNSIHNDNHPATSVESLIYRLRKAFKYSEEKDLVINMNKTKYLDLSTNSISNPLQITDEKSKKSIGKDGYRCLGITMIQSA